MMYLLIMLLALLPFVYAPWLIPAYEVPKVWLYLRFVEVFVVVGLIRFHTLKNKKINTRVLLTVLGFVLWSTITSIVGSNFLKSFWGNYYRGDGLFTLYHHLGLATILGLYFQKSWMSNIKKAITLSSMGLCLWILVNLLIYKNLAQSIAFGHPSFLAIYLAATLPFIPLSTAPFVIAGVLSTKTISGVLGVFIFLLLKIFQRGKIRSRNQLVIITTVVAIVASLFLIYRDTARSIFDNRKRIIVHSLMATSKRPITGWGWANFDYAFESVNWPMKYRFDIYYDKPHSSILETATTTGLLGLILYVTLQTVVIKILTKKIVDPSIFQTYVLVLILAQVNINSINSDVLYWLIVGIAISYGSLAKPKMALQQKVKNKSL